MKQRTYNVELAETALRQLETAETVEEQKEAWLQLSGFLCCDWLREAAKVVVAKEVQHCPEPKWSKMFDSLCSDEMQKRRLDETGYIKAKLKEVRALGARAKDFRLVRRMLSLPGFEMR